LLWLCLLKPDPACTLQMQANLLAFSADDASNDFYRAELQQELGLLKTEYRTLLYGGNMMLQVSIQVQKGLSGSYMIGVLGATGWGSLLCCFGCVY